MERLQINLRENLKQDNAAFFADLTNAPPDDMIESAGLTDYSWYLGDVD